MIKSSFSLIFLLPLLLDVTACKKTSRLENAPYEQTLSEARLQNKKLIVIFGAEWCPDCRALNIMLGDPKISDMLQTKYIILKVDVGRFDQNLILNEKLGDPIGNGIPALVILDPNRNDMILATTRGGEFSNARGMSKAQVYSYLNQF